MYCIHCGNALEPGANFCPQCGERLTANSNAPAPAPSEAVQGAGVALPHIPRICTKCRAELDGDVLFCPVCGTKNYVARRNRIRKGELLMELENCSLVKLQIVKNPGTVALYDDKLCFRASAAANTLIIPYTDLFTVAPQSGISYKYGIKLGCANNKTYQFSLPECYSDVFYYVINLILDYRQ